MKLMKGLYSSLLVTVLILFSTHAAGEETKRSWQTSVCYHLQLSVWDKMNLGDYLAKYTITSADGTVFVAEENAIEDSSAEVVFPDQFHDAKTKLKAWINCNNGENYTWNIYANGALVDSGTITFSRRKPKVNQRENSKGAARKK